MGECAVSCCGLLQTSDPPPGLTVTLPCCSASLACCGLLSGVAPRPNIAPAPCRDLAVHLTQTSPSMASFMGLFPQRAFVRESVREGAYFAHHDCEPTVRTKPAQILNSGRKPSKPGQRKHRLQPRKIAAGAFDVRSLEFGRLAPAPACCQAQR